MTVSSRTPEGLPSRCPLCGAETNLEFSDPGDDAPCPNCGHLLWESTKVFSSFQRLVGEQLGISPDAVSADRSFANDLGADSLDTVELVMELEEEFDVNMPEDAAEQIQTVRDAIRYILEQRRLKEIANQDCLPESGGDKLQVRSTSHRHREIMTLSPTPAELLHERPSGHTIAEVEAGLQKYTVPAKEKFGSPLAAGLWLAAPIMREFAAAPDAVAAFAERLAKMGLPCYTLNAFPYGDFHSPRVKENVYIPDWTRGERLDYTVSCAQVLAALLPPNVQGSISTVPLGFKNLVAAQYRQTEEFIDLCVPRLIELARRLRTLEDATDKLIRLAIEPEPLCVLETTDETLAFFRQLWMAAARLGEEENVRRYLGLCYDVCHQAVEFEDVGTSIAAIDAAGLRINKLHISCAIHLDNPRDEEARRELARYVEPRYLHQTMALAADGRVLRELDLSPELIERPSAEYLAAEAWRVHFHVPVNAETLGPLRTTRPELKQALAAVAKLPYAPHLEVETYTWRVMPGMTVDLADVLAKELSATRELLQPLG